MKGIKTGGRQAGTPNKLTSDTKEIISQIIINEIQSLPTLLDSMKPKDKAEILIKLIPYIIPKASKEDSKLDILGMWHE
jgi:hypothetical protein